MCNKYANNASPDEHCRHFEVSRARNGLGNAEPRPAIYPKGQAPVVRLDAEGRRELIEMRWGFLTPQVSKKTGNPIKPRAWNNARDDKLRKSGLWRPSFETRRCLIPATSFHEPQGEKPATDFWFALEGKEPESRPLFAFAGIWRQEHEELRVEGEPGFSHTMVTTEANDLIRPIHAKGRMPVILEPADYTTWLAGSPDEAVMLIRSFPSERMRIARQGVGVKSD